MACLAMRKFSNATIQFALTLWKPKVFIRCLMTQLISIMLGVANDTFNVGQIKIYILPIQFIFCEDYF